MMKQIPVIDIFAGPGGLSEGFHKYSWFFEDENLGFDIKLSIEKDETAHKTLRLRSFVRQFPKEKLPDEYYHYIQSQTAKEKAERLKPLLEMDEWKTAEEEAWQAELGKVCFKELHSKIAERIKDYPLWILLGGPPCQAYSLIGRSRRLGPGYGGNGNNGEARRQKSDEFFRDERHLLYLEYLEIVALHQPAVFVMENVKGILSAKTGSVDNNGERENIFPKIQKDLSDPTGALREERLPKGWIKYRQKKQHGYRLFSFVVPSCPGEETKPRDYLISSEKHGVPQSRHRVIILGVRDDIDVIPKTIPFVDTMVSLKEMIGDLPALRSGRSGRLETGRGFGDKTDTPERWLKAIGDFTTDKVLSNLGDDKIATIMRTVRDQKNAPASRGTPFVQVDGLGQTLPDNLKKWLLGGHPRGILHHETRAHMDSDLTRYLFVSAFGKTHNTSPKLKDFPDILLPNHKNADTSRKIVSGTFSDRFRVQIANLPGTTITAHISKDGHYFIHYDSKQCRSMTVREAARVQTFPDDYYFEGARTVQYQQVGNAVPPYLAVQLADVVADIFSQVAGGAKIKEREIRSGKSCG